MKELQKQIDELDKKNYKLHADLEKIDVMLALRVYESRENFGELALQNKRPRAGSIVTLSDCFYAVINADNYDRLMGKVM